MQLIVGAGVGVGGGMCGKTVEVKMSSFVNRSGMSVIGHSRVSGVSKDVLCY